MVRHLLSQDSAEKSAPSVGGYTTIMKESDLFSGEVP